MQETWEVLSYADTAVSEPPFSVPQGAREENAHWGGKTYPKRPCSGGSAKPESPPKGCTHTPAPLVTVDGGASTHEGGVGSERADQSLRTLVLILSTDIKCFPQHVLK